MKINYKTTLLITASALAIGLFFGWLIFSRSESINNDEHKHGSVEINETTWTCSMHPQIRQNEPGKCPICGMDLIPLVDEEGSEIDAMAISMSPTAMKLANVSTAVVGKIDPVKTVYLNGKVLTDERLIYSQSSHISGRIEKLMLNFTGEYVKKGQIIAYLYSPQLVTAQEELFEAQKIKDTQSQLFLAAKAKLRNWKLTDIEIDNILKTGEVSEEFPVKADNSGFVTQKNVNLGDYVRKGESLYYIADLSRIWVLFDVYENDLPWIKKGDKVKFTVQSTPGETFHGSISYLDPVIDSKTRVAKARVEFTNISLKLKPEMFVSGVVDAKLPQNSNEIVIPKSAVMWTGKRSVVYVKSVTDKNVSFIMREVILGPSLGDAYIIEDGLKEGEEIAVNGTFSIDAAAQLAGKPSMMSPEGGPAMTGHNHGNNGKTATEKHVETNKVSLNEISIEAKNALKPLFNEYLKMKDALVSDNLINAKKSGIKMQGVLSKINMALFSGESHNIWMKYHSVIQNNLQHTEHFKKIEEMRKAFQSVSDAMIGLANSFKPFNKTLYVQHCPMADNNKGADWLSTQENINNPYFGESMLNCGEVKQKISN